MTRTKSMVYKDTEEARELFLYTINDSQLYFSYIIPAIESLRRKAKKGLYNSEKAINLFYRIATTASNKYNKDFGYSFTVQDRFTTAVELEKYYREDHVFYELEV